MDITTRIEEAPEGLLPFRLLSPSDLAERWRVSLPAVSNRKARHHDFPVPIAYVSRGYVPLYTEPDVERYERAHGLGGE